MREGLGLYGFTKPSFPLLYDINQKKKNLSNVASICLPCEDYNRIQRWLEGGLPRRIKLDWIVLQAKIFQYFHFTYWNNSKLTKAINYNRRPNAAILGTTLPSTLKKYWITINNQLTLTLYQLFLVLTKVITTKLKLLYVTITLPWHHNTLTSRL